MHVKEKDAGKVIELHLRRGHKILKHYLKGLRNFNREDGVILWSAGI